MSVKIEKLLAGKGDNYILPFFWLHGEDEATLRKYMQVIDESHIKAVCVESRPHPDYCGPQWWHDLDIILDEAIKRDMKVWILDDSHFPTGYANGAMKDQPDERCRQGICCKTYVCAANQVLHLEAEELEHPAPWKPSQIEQHIGEKEPRQFQDDQLIGAYAVRLDQKVNGFVDTAYQVDLMPDIVNNTLHWQVPKEGEWKVYLLHLSRNVGYHRSYINMLDETSCKVLLDAVYEPHYARYQALFGTTIAGFFSDEPELGNGHLYEQGLSFGSYEDLPWSEAVAEGLAAKLGKAYISKLILLWEEDAAEEVKAHIRYAYMDTVTQLVQSCFSEQLGTWCRERGVAYIGHLIEDNNQHARLGSSLGHFYRGLWGQDMAGIDNIGGQVLPQKEDAVLEGHLGSKRNGEFYHYMLAKLGSSAAAIEPRKKGRAMCEIFGAYGWEEGVRLEKYLIDHFLVRGINHYVPHAFSPKPFPDPDCPPHFYAHGHNPQYRHFGALMQYTNRVCELISDGYHVAPVGILYHGDAEWAGECMFSHEIGHVLADNQIEYDYLPTDVLRHRDDYKTSITERVLKVNTQTYHTVIVPSMQFMTKALADGLVEMLAKGVRVYLVGAAPQALCDAVSDEQMMNVLKHMESIPLEAVAQVLREKKVVPLSITPADDRIRYYHYEHQDGSAVYLFVNEGTTCYTGEVQWQEQRECTAYDAWHNTLSPVETKKGAVKIEVEPMQSLILVADPICPQEELLTKRLVPIGPYTILQTGWQRSTCQSIDYPNFGSVREVHLPDQLAEEAPTFSGFVRYTRQLDMETIGEGILEITDAYEGVEVFVNGKSLGIQVVPPYRYDLTEGLVKGANELVIEVATTLERAMAKQPDIFGRMKVPTSQSGINGMVKFYN